MVEQLHGWSLFSLARICSFRCVDKVIAAAAIVVQGLQLNGGFLLGQLEGMVLELLEAGFDPGFRVHRRDKCQ